MATAFSGTLLRARVIESRRLDIVIDDRPLRYWWRDWEQAQWEHRLPVPDFVTQLSRSSLRDARDQLDQLRGPKPGHKPTTAELLYCGGCFDISDGILAVEISRTETAVTWQRLGWIDEESDTTDDALIPNAPTLTFDPLAYDCVLDEARSVLQRGYRTRWKDFLGSPHAPR